MIVTFLIFLAAFTLVGLSSAFKSDHTGKDYYLASNSVNPLLVGLSAVATNNSGYMFIGVIGYTYATGLASIWLMIGWILGDFLASLFVHQRLRVATERTGEVSFAGVLSYWYGGHNSRLQRLIGAISVLFLLAYAGAQLVAGSKALHVLFGWDNWVGASLGAAMVALYCLAGGIRASIWTDAAQSVVMIFAMGLLLIVAVSSLGGVTPALNSMQAIPDFMDWVPKDMVFPGVAGGVIFALGWLVAGLSVIGQPHIMVRFMTLRDSGDMWRARAWYYIWFSAFYMMATMVGMLSRIYIQDGANFDAELALPTMAMELLSPMMVGVILAGIFAATMSTADSLILSCSAAITHDLLPHKVENPLLIKGATLLITMAALTWALFNSQSVFSLVILAWSGMASAFAPLLILRCFGWKSSQQHAIVAVIVGLAAAIVWRWFGLHNALYEGLPGIAAGLVVLVALGKLIGDPQHERD
ncbi:sodium/proline symporter PutP [Aurantivibrio plasticivorans]